MRSCLVAFFVLAFGCSEPSTTVRKKVPVRTGAYLTTRGSSLQDSRVQVAYRMISRLDRIPFSRSGIDLVVPAPNDQFLVIRHNVRRWLLNSGGLDESEAKGPVCEVLDRRDLTSRGRITCRGNQLTVGDDGFFLSTHEFRFDALPLGEEGGWEGALAVSFGRRRTIAVFQQFGGIQPHAAMPRAFVVWADNFPEVEGYNGEQFKLPYVAYGAVISPDGLVGVLHLNGVEVMPPRPQKVTGDLYTRMSYLDVFSFSPSSVVRFGERVVSTSVEIDADYLSMVNNWYVLLDARSAFAQGRTTVVALNREGHEAWRTTVPVEACQPAINGTNARVYIVGNGVVALDGGAFAWSFEPVPWNGTSTTPTVRAMAFEDGTLAIASRTKLSIVGRDGALRVELRVPDGEEIRTPPAIAEDGSVWFATDSAIYAAR